MHITYSIEFTHLNLYLGEVTGVGSDGGVSAASVSQRELVQRHSLVLVYLLGRLDGRGTFPGRASAASWLARAWRCGSGLHWASACGSCLYHLSHDCYLWKVKRKGHFSKFLSPILIVYSSTELQGSLLRVISCISHLRVFLPSYKTCIRREYGVFVSLHSPPAMFIPAHSSMHSLNSGHVMLTSSFENTCFLVQRRE